jgi:predicted heme/steroid binding protein
MFLRPKSLRSGIPEGEKKLGLSCISILAASGVYLTWYRLDSVSSFFDSRFGVLLFVKILFFILLVCSGVLAVTVINRKMKKESREGLENGPERADSAVEGSGGEGGAAEGGGPEPAETAGGDPGGAGAKDASAADIVKQLPTYDGKEGRPAYVQYKNRIYDVTESAKWKGGSHFTQHFAGKDLTDDMANAPHTEEVLSRFPIVATITEEQRQSGEEPAGPAQKIFPIMAYINLGIVIAILICVGAWLFDFPRFTVADSDGTAGIATGEGGLSFSVSGGDIVSGVSSDGEQHCIVCHRKDKPALVTDWERSIHAKLDVTCADCHKVVDEKDVWISETHLRHTEVPVTPLVTPVTCARCHEEEVEQYSRSKHAHTLEIINQIDKWLIHGMNNETERATGCFACHGSKVEVVDGRPVKGTWPNVGVGRVNPDGSLGSCTSCHTRHRFSIVEARKPEACDQCHLGPDHPQIEIYNESKHGTMYHAYGDDWTWRPEDFKWTAGRDYRAPTCAACHMSEAGSLPKSHDVTKRLAWELQAPLTVRPSEFAPYPSGTDWKEERESMRSVCLQCHSEAWTDGHFDNMDTVIELYNNEYYLPVKEVMDRLYAQGLLTEDSYFDEAIEWEFYELWHHEGRRARMGAAMMAPDYAWWHGFYECKHRFIDLIEMAEELTAEEKAEWAEDFPGRLDNR